jgi:hypothetical protein
MMPDEPTTGSAPPPERFISRRTQIAGAGSGATAMALGGLAALTHGGSIVLHPGEGFFLPQGTVHLRQNAGTEPTVIMVATLFAADQPDLVWTKEQGTPTP